MLFLPIKSDPKHHRVLYESMAEYTTEKYSILTYFGNKKIWKIKENAPAHNIRFFKLMVN